MLKGGVGSARPPSQSVGVHWHQKAERGASDRAPHSPPPTECDLQQKSDGADATKTAGLSEGVYAIHRSWWPSSSAEDSDRLLDAHLSALIGHKPSARLEGIIRALDAEHAAGNAREPGKLVERRIEKANARARTEKPSARTGAADTTPFRPQDVLGRVGFGDKVTGVDAMDILSEVRGSDPDMVRRLIREVSGKWVGVNGKTKSTQHVVDEVVRLLRAPDAKGQAEIPRETIVVSNLSNSAKGGGARLAALRKQMPSTRPPACAKDTTTPQRGNHR
jgi:hypothetical protein